MIRQEIGGIPEGLRRLAAQESDPATLMTVAKFLKSIRSHLLLAWFTEKLLRRDPDLRLWQLHAQALVELGFLSAAEEVLDGLDDRIKSESNVGLAVDLFALRGRIHKQRLVEAVATDSERQKHLDAAVKFYDEALARAGENPSLRYYPGVNIVGLLEMARRLKLHPPPGPGFEEITAVTRADVDAVAKEESEFHWWQATKAEIAVAQRDYVTFAKAVKCLVDGRKNPSVLAHEEAALERIRAGGYFETLPAIDLNSAEAFVLNSFHRQLMEIWAIDEIKSTQLANAVMGLRQALLRRRGGSLEFDAATLKIIDRYVKQAVFAQDAPMPFAWVLKGIERAKPVAAILHYDRFGALKRIGTGFLVRLENQDGAHHLLTNEHVIRQGFKTLYVRFEAVDDKALHRFDALLWASEAHDAALLELRGAPEGIIALEFRDVLPPLPNDHYTPRLYAIGHTAGEELHMSLQDNELLDHEGECELPKDAPVRLHYRTPTREGNSGSPVFQEENWEVIAIHRGSITLAGGTDTTLSGHRRYNQANEGVSIASIDAALSSASGLRLKRLPDR